MSELHKQKSKKLSYVLRHNPDDANIKLEEGGWAPVSVILTYLRMTILDLEELVESDSKGRYSFNDTKTKIRANQGHSTNVEIEFKPVTDLDVLYHGTSSANWSLISRSGLIKPQTRQWVHLSKDKKTALDVAKRHGSMPVCLTVDVKKARENGVEFFISDNGVYLVKQLEIKYIKCEKF